MKLNTTLMPTKGHILACFPEQLIFEEYVTDETGIHFPGSEILDTMCPYECHCFDDKVEYRSFYDKREQKLKELQFTQAEENEMPPELLKEETVWIQEKYWKTQGQLERLRLVYRYHFTENDTLAMVNYRLAGVVR